MASHRELASTKPAGVSNNSNPERLQAQRMTLKRSTLRFASRPGSRGALELPRRGSPSNRRPRPSLSPRRPRARRSSPRCCGKPSGDDVARRTCSSIPSSPRCRKGSSTSPSKTPTSRSSSPPSAPSPASASSTAARSATSRRPSTRRRRITVAEAYQAFLSILETNGLTVIPHGTLPQDRRDRRRRRRRRTPIYGAGQPVPRRGSLRHAPVPPRRTSAPTTSRTCSASSSRKDGDITVYGAGQPAHHHRHRDEHPPDDRRSSRRSTSAARAIRSGSSRSTTRPRPRSRSASTRSST